MNGASLLTHLRRGDRRRMIAMRLLIVSLLAAFVVALVGRPALAECAEPPDLETAFAEADVVFIGVVIELSNRDRTAVMNVEQVWKGPQLLGVVTVHGGPTDPGMITTVDRTFERGTYVVFPINSAPPFEDNACTLTQRTTSALEVINPFAAEPPEDPGVSEPVITTVTSAAIPATTAANVGGAAALESSTTDDGAIQPWIFPIGIGSTLLAIVILVWRRRAQRHT